VVTGGATLDGARLAVIACEFAFLAGCRSSQHAAGGLLARGPGSVADCSARYL
jgi:acetyl-CoA carboxylase beta subunit